MPIRLRRVIPLGLAVLAVGGAAACGEKSEEAATNPPEPPGFEIEGAWSGELHQKGLHPFEVDAEIGSLDNPKQNTVRYTGIDCSGNWTFLGHEDAKYRFHELIDRGKGGECRDAGTVTLTPITDEKLDYEFRGGGIESTGLLSRGGGGGGGGGGKAAGSGKSKQSQGGKDHKKQGSGGGGKQASGGSGKPSRKDIGVGSDQDVPDTGCSYSGAC